MSVELILFLMLALVFLVGTLAELNIGILGIFAAFVAGSLLLDLDANTVIDGFPDRIFMMIFGLTLLTGIALSNGSVNWITGWLIRHSGGRLAVLPWAFFIIALVVGAFGTATAPILMVLAAALAPKYGIPPLLFGAMIIHGNQAGLFSPVAPYGAILTQLSEQAGFSIQSITMFVCLILFHVVIGVVAFWRLGGHGLMGRRISAEQIQTEISASGPLTLHRAATLASFLLVMIGVVWLKLDLGLLAVFFATILLLMGDKAERQDALKHVPWGVLTIIVGVLMYVNVMQEADAFNWLMRKAEVFGSPKAVALFLTYMSAAVTAFTSTFGTFGIIIPMSAPLLAPGTISPTLLVTALAVAAATADVSPISPFGALYLSLCRAEDRAKLFSGMLFYVLIIATLVPFLAWLVFVAFN